MDVDETALAELFEATREAVARHPLCAAQVAVARDGRLVGAETFGRAMFGGVERDATDDSLFSIYSCTKTMTASAVWILLQEGRIGLGDRVVDHVPEFGGNGKEAVTVEHLLTHTSGFPEADFDAYDWPDPGRRLSRFASWELEWEPGTRFTYHGKSSYWVLAEIIGRASGSDYRDFIRTRILEPLGLNDLYMGLPESELSRVADVIRIGEPMTEDEQATTPVDAPAVDDGDVAFANGCSKRIIGSPNGGAKATAADLVLFYQALLADSRGEGPGLWESDVLRGAWTSHTRGMIDPITGQAACWGLGVVVSGGEDRLWRGFPLECSAEAFGHMGAAGQLSWADPASGLSFAYVTNGADQNPVLQGMTGFLLSSLAVKGGMPPQD